MLPAVEKWGYVMRRFLPILITAVVQFLFILSAVSQATFISAEKQAEILANRYSQAMQTKDWTSAVATAQQLVALKPKATNMKLLADALLFSGSANAALTTYDKALAKAQEEKPAEGESLIEWKDGLAEIYIGEGNALLKLKRTVDAIAAYNQSAAFASNAGRANFNICAVLYNNGNTRESAVACRKCVQADPTRANAWFILGSVLFADAPIDNGKVAATAETRLALEKYLELAPDGPHAADVKAMLEMIAK